MRLVSRWLAAVRIQLRRATYHRDVINHFDRIATRTLLDVADSLPRFRGGMIRWLQGRRARQRRSARQAFKSSRPATNTKFRYSRLRLYEIYSIEQMDELESTIHLLFGPERLRSQPHENFRMIASSTGTSAWALLGELIQQGSKFLPLSFRPTYMRLPSDAKFVRVSARKILSSVVILTFDVHFEDSINRNIDRLENTAYLPDLRFLSWKPSSGPIPFGTTSNTAESEAEVAAATYFLNVRRSWSKFLRPYLSGHFTRLEDKSKTYPALEIFTVEGLPAEKSLSQWFKESERWARWLGWDHFVPSVFASEELLFTASTTFTKVPTSHRVCIRLDDSATWRAPFQEPDMISTETWIVLLHLLRSIRAKLQLARAHSWKRIGSQSGRGLLADARTIIGVQPEINLLSRLCLELRDSIQRTNDDDLGALHSVNQDSRTLGPVLKERIVVEVESLQQQAKLLTESLRQRIDIRNMTTSLSLQNQMWLLTAVATLATVVGLFSNPEVRGFFFSLLNNLPEWITRHLLPH